MTKNKKKLLLTFVEVVLIIIFASAGCYGVLGLFLKGVQQSFETEPTLYLAAGNTISGTVQDKFYDAGVHTLNIETEKFGVISVDCSTDMYNVCSQGDTVFIDFELTAHK